MLVGPDGKPVQVTPVIGAPKLTDLHPLSPKDMEAVAAPIREAMEAGVHSQSPCNVEFGMVARLVATVLHLQTPLPTLTRDGAEE
jgi:hypothetical protein